MYAQRPHAHTPQHAHPVEAHTLKKIGDGPPNSSSSLLPLQNALLEQVGLTEQQHTRAGNAFIRGLSGGLKRRLSIALALAKQPQVLFLDEPTTGVDSASAAKMMTFLKTIAASNNIAIVCTIHQPSAPVFAGFDDALVLASGRVAYFGQAAKIGEHFTKLGQPLPLNCNPAEFVLDCVNKDFTSVAGVEAILDGWDAAAPPKPEFEVSDLPKPPRRANYVTQICVLLRRQLLLLVKDPSLYVARCVMNMVLVSIFAIVYLEARKTIQTQALQRCFVFCMAIPSQLSIGVVILNNFGLKSIAREVKDGMYNPVCQWIASSIVQALMMILLAACALWPAFWGLSSQIRLPERDASLLRHAVDLRGLGRDVLARKEPIKRHALLPLLHLRVPLLRHVRRVRGRRRRLAMDLLCDAVGLPCDPCSTRSCRGRTIMTARCRASGRDR